MAELARFYGIVIAIYFRDFGAHNLPHIHAGYGGEEAVIAISDGRVLAGSIPRLALRLVREWLRLRRTAVEHAWASAKRGEPVDRIAGLHETGRKGRSGKRRG